MQVLLVAIYNMHNIKILINIYNKRGKVSVMRRWEDINKRVF